MVQYKMVPLGELFDIGSSKRVFQSEWREQGVPFYRTREIAKLSANGYVDNELFIDEELYEKYIKEYGKPEAGDIMVTGVGTLGVCYVVQKQDKFYFKDGNILWFRQKNRNRVLPEYIVKAFDSNYVKDEIRKNSSGTTVGTFTIQTANTLEIPLPDISVQQIVVDKLSAVEKLMTLHKQQLAKLDELVKARFVELFENSNYPTIRLGDVCTKITDGTHKTPTYLESGITFISAKNIVNGELDFSDIKHISEQEYDEIQRRCQTEIGDILLSKSGSLGSPVIVKTTQKLGLFESLAVIKYDRDRLLPEFLCEQLKTDRIQRQLKVGTKGVAIKHLHLGVIADTDIVIPPIEEQQVFAAFVEQTDKSKLSIQQSLNKLELLKKALMQKYFG